MDFYSSSATTWFWVYIFLFKKSAIYEVQKNNSHWDKQSSPWWQKKKKKKKRESPFLGIGREEWEERGESQEHPWENKRGQVLPKVAEVSGKLMSSGVILNILEASYPNPQHSAKNPGCWSGGGSSSHGAWVRGCFHLLSLATSRVRKSESFCLINEKCDWSTCSRVSFLLTSLQEIELACDWYNSHFA